MNEPLPNRADFELNTEKAGGVAGKVDRDQIVAETYIQVNNPAPPENAALTLDIDPSKYTPEELAVLIETIMKSVSIIGDGTLKLAYYKKGSIKLVLNGSPEDIAELQRLINSKELTQIEGHNIAEIQETTPEEDTKISRIQRIKVDEVNWGEAYLRKVYLSGVYLRKADLHGADLSGANLSMANLSGANLSMANLSGANLSEADLNKANLSEAVLLEANLSVAVLLEANLSVADLSGAFLKGASFSGANLTGANLNGADLTWASLRKANLTETRLENTTVSYTRFGNNQGIDEALKADLIKRGAIFDDAPGDRSRVPTPV